MSGAGIYPDMDEATYRAAPAVSCSTLKRFADAPAKAHVALPETDSMRAGRLIHSAVMEAWSFDARYQRTDLDRRGTEAWQEEEAAALSTGRTLIKTAEYDKLAAIRDAVHAHPTARELLAPGLTTETAVFWDDPLTGARCRARMDGIRRDMQLVLDVKTTGDASPREFARSAAKLRMHWQAAWYLDGIAAAPGGFRPEAFLFIAVERDAPHLIAVYELPTDAIDAGRRQIRAALHGYLECERRGEWPGYPPTITPLHLPEWALINDEESAA
jgi:hypothetical protein